VDLADWAARNGKVVVFGNDGLKLDFHTLADGQKSWLLLMAKVFLLLSSFAEIEGQPFAQRAKSRVRPWRPS
jgi:hypothetical protein